MKSNPSCPANCVIDTVESGLCDCYNNGTHPECREEKLSTAKCLMVIVGLVAVSWGIIFLISEIF